MRNGMFICLSETFFFAVGISMLVSNTNLSPQRLCPMKSTALDVNIWKCLSQN